MQTTELITYYPTQQRISYCELELLRDAICNMTEQICWTASDLIWFFWRVLHKPEMYHIYENVWTLVVTRMLGCNTYTLHNLTCHTTSLMYLETFAKKKRDQQITEE